MNISIPRRSLLKVSLLGLSGLGLGFYLNTPSSKNVSALLEREGGFLPNAFIHISDENVVTLYCKNPEIGQGIQTAFAMLAAEELHVAVDKVQVEQALVSYEVYGRQVTAGSLSVKHNYSVIRTAAASAFYLLRQAALIVFEESDPKQIRLENNYAFHSPTQKRLSYGELASIAASLPLPSEKDLQLTPVSEFQVIGHAQGGLNNHAMLTGKMPYVSDINEPEMLYANFIRSAKPGRVIAEFNQQTLRSMPGIIEVRYFADNEYSAEALNGIAIVGLSSWQVLKARRALKVSWSGEGYLPSPTSPLSSGASLKQALSGGKTNTLEKRDVGSVDKHTTHQVSASYSYPFLAHNTMENQVCVARYSANEMTKLSLWQNSQRPYFGVKAAAKYLDIPVDEVSAKQFVAGGGFGRRLYNDVVVQAAAIAKSIPERTVKLFYTKEDDFTNDFFRAACLHDIHCAASSESLLVHWQQTVYSLSDKHGRPVNGAQPPVSGFPYDWCSVLDIKQALTPLNIRCGAWRSPGANGHAFASQSALQELADTMGLDYPEFLISLIKQKAVAGDSNFDPDRAIAVIKRACELADWESIPPPGSAKGFAFYESHDGYFAEVVSLSLLEGQRIRLDNILAVGDVGIIINPSGAQAQVKGAILDALEASLFQQVAFDSSGVLTKSQAAYATLNVMQVPNIQVAFITSQRAPTGLGEPALPPLAPALCHALLKVSGVRVRHLPILQNSAFTLV